MSEVRQRKLLVVDDNTAFLDLVAVVFGGEWKVLGAEDGAAGLDLARRERPDLILLDLTMPRLSGSELLRELQSEAETRSIPVIVVTGNKLDDAELARVQGEPNVKSVLKKPCGIEALRGQVRAALETAK